MSSALSQIYITSLAVLLQNLRLTQHQPKSQFTAVAGCPVRVRKCCTNVQRACTRHIIAGAAWLGVQPAAHHYTQQRILT